MQNQNPLISVIIPVYNGEIYLAQAIESILSQTYQPLDVIVIDDGSTDRSGKIAQSFLPRIHYHKQPNCGIGSALNKGIKLATGQYYSFLDADDLWMGHKLTRQMAAFAQNSKVDAIFSQIEQFYSSDMTLELRRKYRYAQKIISGYCVDTLLIKRKAFNRVGNFNPDLRTTPFIDWYARANDQGLHFELIPVILAKRRIHNTNMGILNKGAEYKGYTRILKTILDRRRTSKDNIRKGQDPESIECYQ